MTRYMSLNCFLICSEIIEVCSGSSNSTTKTWYFSWIVTRDSHTKILNSQPWSRPTRQRSAAHQWAAALRLRTAVLGCPNKTFFKSSQVSPYRKFPYDQNIPHTKFQII